MDRLTRIEEALAHQGAEIDSLNEVVRAQQDEIDRLTRRMAMLMQRTASEVAESTGAHMFTDSKPPHY